MPFRDLPYLPSPIPWSLSVHRLAEPPSLSFSRIAFHLACIRPTRRRLLRFMRTGPRAMGRSLWVTQWFPIVVLVTRKRRTSNHWKEERDEAIEWSVWRILLILSANHSTMESLAGSLVIITALKTHTFTIVLTRISQLLAHNFSHIKLCEDVYIYIYLFDRTFQLAVRTTHLLREPAYTITYTRCSVRNSWLVLDMVYPLRRSSSPMEEQKESEAKECQAWHAQLARTTQRVHRVSCFMHDRGKRVPFTRLSDIYADTSNKYLLARVYG